MKNILKITFVPLLALFIFILGSGLFTTLVTMRLHSEQSGSLLIGLMTGVYYLGLAIGSFKIEKIILRAGHIRSFAAFASSVSIISLLQGLFINHSLWLLLRLVNGFSTAGIFVVIESWLLAAGSINNRGQVLALYMISLYAAQASGQFLVNMADEKTITLFALTSMLSSLAIIPLSLTKNPSPELSEPSTLNFKRLFSKSASGVIAAFSSGLMLGSFYGLLPLIALLQGADRPTVAWIMALLITGGMLLQYPIGKISDLFERRLVLLGLSVFLIFLSIMFLIDQQLDFFKYFLFFMLGGSAFTLYPVSISHTCDSLDQEDIIAGTQGVLLIYSIGAATGPLFASICIHSLGSNGFFIYLLVIAFALSLFLGWRKINVSAPMAEENFRVLPPQITAVVAELDPRSTETVA